MLPLRNERGATLTQTNFNDISYECDELGIVTLKFDTPERKNALSVVTFHELWCAIDAFEKDANAHVMIVTGAVAPDTQEQKEAFSSGGYFSHDVLDNVAPEIVAEIDLSDIAQKRATLKIFECDKPILFAINGLAIGGAVTLALAGADQIYMSEHAWMQLPFAKLGINVELASSVLLPHLVGMQKAKEILFFADRIDANKAEQLGLVSAVLPHSELLEYTYEQALKLAPPVAPPLSIRGMKKLLSEPLREMVTQALDRENELLHELFKTEDFAEGVAARVERRVPAFKGN